VGVGAVGVDADVVGDGVAGLAEFIGEDAGGAGLGVGELRVSVDVFVDVDEGSFLREERSGDRG
jgi:hypothetical protein